MNNKWLKIMPACFVLLASTILLVYWCYYSPYGPSFGPGDRLLIPESYRGWLIVQRMVKGVPALPIAHNRDDRNVQDNPKGYYEYMFSPEGKGYLAIPTDHHGLWHGPDEAYFYNGSRRAAVPIPLTEIAPEDALHNQRLKASNQIAVWPDFGGVYSVPVDSRVWNAAFDSWYVGTYQQFEQAKSKVPDAESQVRLLLSVRH